MEMRPSREELQTAKLLTEHPCRPSEVCTYLLQTKRSSGVFSTPTSPSASETQHEESRWSQQMCKAHWAVWYLLCDPMSQISECEGGAILSVPRRPSTSADSIKEKPFVLFDTLLKGHGKHSPSPAPGAKWSRPSNPRIRKDHLPHKLWVLLFLRQVSFRCVLRKFPFPGGDL